MRGATPSKPNNFNISSISIHAPHAGCDDYGFDIYYTLLDFNPRTPCGVRRDDTRYHLYPEEFQSTHPMRGATIKYIVN